MTIAQLQYNYNMSPTIKNKGSAIFIHVTKQNYKKTEGCVALKKRHLLNPLTVYILFTYQGLAA